MNEYRDIYATLNSTSPLRKARQYDIDVSVLLTEVERLRKLTAVHVMPTATDHSEALAKLEHALAAVGYTRS